MSKKVLVVNDFRDLGSSYYRPFREFGEETHDVDLIEKGEIGLVVFTGGEDVDPSLYNQKKHPFTYCNSLRDAEEIAAFKRASAVNLPLVGICRGSQFLCVMAGGTLIQHINNHGGYHTIRTNDDRLLRVNSTHHQMQNPPKNAVVLAWAEPKRSHEYYWDTPEKEFECVAYPNINAVGMQYHPEAMDEKSEGFQYCLELTRKLLDKKLW